MEGVGGCGGSQPAPAVPAAGCLSAAAAPGRPGDISGPPWRWTATWSEPQRPRGWPFSFGMPTIGRIPVQPRSFGGILSPWTACRHYRGRWHRVNVFALNWRLMPQGSPRPAGNGERSVWGSRNVGAQSYRSGTGSPSSVPYARMTRRAHAQESASFSAALCRRLMLPWHAEFLSRQMSNHAGAIPYLHRRTPVHQVRCGKERFSVALAG